MTQRHRIELSSPVIMGIVNLTPDSFSDGGRHDAPSQGMAHCELLLSQGAGILDLGAESSRPGAQPLLLEEERKRLMPVLRHALTLGCPVSIDTYKPEIMAEALDMGADIINDIHGFSRPGAIEAVAAFPGAGLCVMHMQGTPTTMQERPHYQDVLAEVCHFLRQQVDLLLSAGVEPAQLVLDPGVGFGKRVEDNFALLARQEEVLRLGYPVMAAWSRKSSLGAVTGREVGQRLAASVAAAVLAMQGGARVLRVHDVSETRDAVAVWMAMRGQAGAATASAPAQAQV